MKINVLIFNSLFVFFSCVTTFSQNQTFVNIEKWYMGNKIGGEITVLLTILSIDKDKARISIRKEMSPFSQILDITTDAKNESGKYFFRCLDNWENIAFGYFYFENEQIILFLDCEKYSDFGKNVARFYGDTATLGGAK